MIKPLNYKHKQTQPPQATNKSERRFNYKQPGRAEREAIRMKTLNDNPIYRHLSQVEREFRTAGKIVPPTGLLFMALDDYLKERHPNVHHPDYEFSENPFSIGFDDDGFMFVIFEANPLIPHTDLRVSLKFCRCGNTPLLISSVSDEDGLRLILGVISHDCEHGYVVSRQEQKPASKKRRQRDARKQAA